MPIFYYKAKKENAETVLGQISARDQEEAVDLINRMGLVAVSLENKSTQYAQSEILQRRVKQKEVYVFTRQLFNLLKSGISILRALEIIGAQTRNPNLKSVIANINAGIRDGRALSECLNDYRLIFSPLYISLIKVGEESGNLKEVLFNITEYQRSQAEILTKLKSACVYPSFMGIVGMATVVFILTFVLPRIMGLFGALKEDLPVPTKMLLTMSHFLIQWWLGIILFFIVLVFLWSRFAQSAKGKIFISRAKLTMPFLGTFTLKVEIARLTRTLELLLKSGIPILRAMQIATTVLTNELLRDAFGQVHSDLIKGISLGASLRQFPVIPSLLSDLVLIGEESGSLTDVLREIASNYESDIKETIRVGTTLMEPVMILTIGLVVGFIVFAMLLPIFQIDTMVR